MLSPWISPQVIDTCRGAFSAGQFIGVDKGSVRIFEIMTNLDLQTAGETSRLIKPLSKAVW
jgi:hypothetical protein